MSEKNHDMVRLKRFSRWILTNWAVVDIGIFGIRNLEKKKISRTTIQRCTLNKNVKTNDALILQVSQRTLVSLLVFLSLIRE